MATLKIGNAHNESGQKFFASNDLTTNSTDLLWKGARVLTEASFTVSGDFEGTGSADSPLSWKGFKAENAEGTVLSETVKTIKAGTNVTLSAQDGVLTIESEGGTGGSVDLSDYTGGVLLKNEPENVGYDAAFSIGSNGVIKLSTTGLITIGGQTAGNVSGSPSEVNITGQSLTINTQDGIRYNNAFLNEPGGLVKLGSDGKIPSNLYDAGGSGTEIDWSNVNATEIKLNGSEGIWFNTVMNDIFLKPQNGAGTLFIDAMDIQLNECGLNQPTGLVQLTPEGKIPTELYDAGGSGTEIDINAMVRIYDATVDAETGVVTITDGTQVADLRIGDEIRTPDGVYQKIKDNITTTGSADGTRIEVSGITNPADANGVYILTETEKVWKHESADYWISQWTSQESESFWLIANTSSPSNPGMAIFIGPGSSSSMPWEMSDWSAMNGSGSPVLENASTEQTITDTLALFEYASLPVEPENIVQSVNGNKPDASGNVTIETSSGGLTSVAVGNGLTGNGTSSSPIKFDLSRAVMEHDCDINAQGRRFSVSLLNEVEISATSISLTSDSLELITGPVNIFIQEDSLFIDASQILLNRHNQNAAGGFAVVGEDGKLPSSILPAMSQTWTKAALNQSDFSTTDDTYGGSYKELDGICSVEVYDADGYKVEFDVKCDFTGNKTRVYIPSGLAADTISNWTLLYHTKTIA